MLGKHTVTAMIAVKDLEAARKFYGETLGLEQVSENLGGVAYKSGDGKMFVYPTPNAGTNKATTANWEVTGIEAIVEELRGKGITFEQYDYPGTKREGDVHIMGPVKGAWFKDPDGNILGLTEVIE